MKILYKNKKLTALRNSRNGYILFTIIFILIGFFCLPLLFIPGLFIYRIIEINQEIYEVENIL